MAKLRKNSRKSSRFSRKRISLKDVIAGVFSPVSAAKRIQSRVRSKQKRVRTQTKAATRLQSSVRGRSIRQVNKRDSLLDLISKGASVYKSAITRSDFRGINMADQILSKRVLDNANFEKVIFHNARLVGCKLNNVNAKGAEFHRASLKNVIAKGSNFEKAYFISADMTNFKIAPLPCKRNVGQLYSFCGNLKKCNFQNTELVNTSFEDCDLRNSFFKEAILIGTNFSRSDLTGCVFENCAYHDKIDYRKSNTPNNCSFLNCKINNVTIKVYRANDVNIFKFFSDVQKEISNLTIEKFATRYINDRSTIGMITDIKFISKNFTRLILKNTGFTGNIRMNNDSSTNKEKPAIFNMCHFTNCNFTENVLFFKTEFNNCTFNDCNFKGLTGHSSDYKACEFTDCNLNGADLRSCILSGSTFRDCNLTQMKFNNSILHHVIFNNCNLDRSSLLRCRFSPSTKFLTDTILTNIDFQEATGLNNFDFGGLNLQGARLIGIDLKGSDFRNCNLRGCQFDFSEVHGCDFTGADVTGSNVTVAEGRHETVGLPEDMEEGRAVDTHKTFYNININKLINFYIDKASLTGRLISNDELLRETALDDLTSYVNEIDMSEAEKNTLKASLNLCFTARLNTYDFSKIVAGTDPRVNFRDLIYTVIKYLSAQPKEFRDLYVQSLILDSTEAYGPGGMSCAAGIVERFVTVMEQAAAVVKDTIPAKTEEYTELINIITNDPKALIKTYQQQWFEFHKEGGPNAFPADMEMDAMMADYENFLKEKFDFANLRGDEKTKIAKIIDDDPNAGVNITREYIENMVLFFGGKIKKRGKDKIFNLLKERFYIKKSKPSGNRASRKRLFKKLFNKSRSLKHKSIISNSKKAGKYTRRRCK
tara:strand:+ start:2092 stop:4722 length:2631 start_codon:yes stop_codon:yes gene_type:complete